jgi:hypothetical protein
MPSCGSLILYIICIPTIIIILFANAPSSQSFASVVQQSASHIFGFRELHLPQKKISGRHFAVRRELGLEEEQIHQRSRHLAQYSRDPETDSIVERLHFPGIKRTLGLIGEDTGNLPVLDDAPPPATTPLKLTSDSTWDYGNSKQRILDDFAAVAQRDAEEVALHALTKAKQRSRTRKKMKPLSSRSKLKV